MIYNLVKKDFILIKKYIPLILIFLILAPNFLNSKITVDDGGFMIYSITVMFALFQANNTVFTLEEKCKGAVLLSATPYSRSNIVKARYIFLASIFIIAFLAYTVMSFIPVLSVAKLSFLSFTATLLMATLYFSLLLPLQYKLGHVKTRFVSFFVIFSVPFLLPSLVKWIAENNISLTLPVPPIFQGLVMGIVGLVLFNLSMRLSTLIYKKKSF